MAYGKIKAYVPKPGQPMPTPAPGGAKGDGKVYAGGPGFGELNNLTPGTRKRKERIIRNPIGVKPKPLAPIIRKGDLIRKPIGKTPGRKTIQQLPQKKISSMRKTRPTVRNSGGR